MMTREVLLLAEAKMVRIRMRLHRNCRGVERVIGKPWGSNTVNRRML